MDTHEQRDLRSGTERRDGQRRQDVPESVKPFLGWLVPEERRGVEERRAEERRTVS